MTRVLSVWDIERLTDEELKHEIVMEGYRLNELRGRVVGAERLRDNLEREFSKRKLTTQKDE